MVQQRLQKMSFSPKLLSNSVLSYTPKKCQTRVQITIFIPKLWMQKKGGIKQVSQQESRCQHMSNTSPFTRRYFLVPCKCVAMSCTNKLGRGMKRSIYRIGQYLETCTFVYKPTKDNLPGTLHINLAEMHEMIENDGLEPTPSLDNEGTPVQVLVTRQVDIARYQLQEGVDKQPSH